MRATVYAIANQKGGVGKTTTAVNLGAALAEAGCAVLVVDLDPQMNATSALGIRGASERGVYEAMLDGADARELVVTTEAGVAVLPSTAELAGADVELVTQLAREFRLKRALDPLLDGYEYILVDCAPSLGLLTVNALTAAHQVLVPVQCEYLALEGLGQLIQTVELVRSNLNPGLIIGGVLLTMFDARTKLAQQVVDEVRKHFSQTFDTVIPRSVRVSEAPSYGRSVLAYDGSSRAASAYRALAREVMERTRISAGRAGAGG